ncbi:MAG: fimbrillin family protein, partial [Cytophagales bacterium]|nr:fimbrillin family protein [Cytophagales bacterium]
MKTYKHLFLSLAAITAFFCSCSTSSSPEPETKSWKKIQLTTSIQEANSKTALSSARTSGLDFDSELAQYGFGFFAAYETEEPQNAAGWYKNEKIVRSGENWASESGEEMQWKSANQAYSVYAYAPYLTEENAYLSLDGDDIRIAVPASQDSEEIQEKLDLLHWKRQEPFKPGDLSNGVLPIEFQRQMAKVQVRITAGDNLEASKDLTAETFRVKNIASTARFNLHTGALTLDESAEKIAEASGKFSAASSSASYELLVLPQSTSGVSFEFRLDGQVYPVNLSELRIDGRAFTALEKGTHYAFEVKLHRDRGNLPTKLTMGNVRILNWKHKSTDLGDLGKPAPAGENSLFEAIRATKIKNDGVSTSTVNIGINIDMEAAFEFPEDAPELF